VKRKRRTPEEARREILSASATIVLNEGPGALKIKTVAAFIGISHPTILHHFGSAEGLLSALQQDMTLQIRRVFFSAMNNVPKNADRMSIFHNILEVISNKEHGAILAFLLATGVDPFPPKEDRGLEKIALMLGEDRPYPISELKRIILTVLLATYGESLLGDHLRQRMGLAEQSPTELRTWMLDIFSKHLTSISIEED
jgi:TetR/AcrR family transcriptional regulator, repressor for neighboring sulfatase